MKILDPGHNYIVNNYDGEPGAVAISIPFMKRCGDGYPGNIGSNPGTNCQELLRVLIDRVKYLNNQYEHKNNKAIIRKLRESLWLFEDRAAERHGFAAHDFDFRPEGIELEPTCKVCGHLMCKGHDHE